MWKASGKRDSSNFFFFFFFVKQPEVNNKVSGLILFIRLAGERKSVALDYCLAGIINSPAKPSSE